MAEELGLRERKKQETRRNLSTIATRLFAERGFDEVTVTDIAAAANVAEKTVYNYFPTKEDLVLVGGDELEAEMLRALRERPVGTSVMEALRRHTQEVAVRIGALPRDRALAFRRVMQATPSVRARWLELLSRREDAIARLLAEETQARKDDATPRIVSGLLGIVTRLAFSAMTGWPDDGGTPAERAARIDVAFALLEKGLGNYGGKRRK